MKNCVLILIIIGLCPVNLCADEQDLFAEGLKQVAALKPKVKTPADIFTERVDKLSNIVVKDHADLSILKGELIPFLNKIKFTPEGDLDITQYDQDAAAEFFLGTDNTKNKVLKKKTEGYGGLQPGVLRMGMHNEHLLFLWEATQLLGQINPKITAQKNNVYNQPVINNLLKVMTERNINP